MENVLDGYNEWSDALDAENNVEEMLDILYAEAVGTGHEDDDEWLDTYDILAAHYPGGMFPEDRHA